MEEQRTESTGPVSACERCLGDEDGVGLRWGERVEERDEVVEDDVEDVGCQRSGCGVRPIWLCGQTWKWVGWCGVR